MPSGEQKVFRSFEEIRAHFFPKQAKKEAKRAAVTVNGIKVDDYDYKRQIRAEEADRQMAEEADRQMNEELAREMDL